MIPLESDKVIDFLTWPPTDFSALKCLSEICYLIIKNRLPCYCRWRYSDVLIKIIYFVSKLLLNYCSFKASAGCPPGSSSSRTALQHTQRTAHRTWLQAKSRFHHKGPVVSISVDYRLWGATLEPYCQLKTKPKTIAEVKEALQIIWGNLPQGTIDKAVNNLSK